MEKHMNRRSAMRRNFGRIPPVIDMPNLIDVQRISYDHFLQRNAEPDEILDEGLEGVFRSVFPSAMFPTAPISSSCATRSNRPSTRRWNAWHGI